MSVMTGSGTTTAGSLDRGTHNMARGQATELGVNVKMTSHNSVTVPVADTDLLGVCAVGRWPKVDGLM